WLKESFPKMVRTQNLLKLAAPKSDKVMAGLGDFQARAGGEIELPGVKKAVKGGPERGKIAYHGDDLRLRIRNPGRVAVDVTVLYVNARFGIAALFPAKDSEHNRVEPGQAVTLQEMEVDKETAGLEHMVVVAVKAEGDLVDFV